ncbi:MULTISPECIES: HEPN domain-containing protein [Vitreoscilla]|uniref:Apea-like HEPN domain-containing protein n=1 Tax=Vitreoscilla stercoraria TaxID=61 RepID=A0ABY4EBH7_VITST|nr:MULTISPECIES: HEPN domain-containing protein [Vitreoscilla]AUZ05815.1 hypothetical protein ADP71_24830 [Vitreoscilla sp. C1]UOO92807.1 hypothetical protein LVJ81_01805 [Vitreoscilla stercoraria]
MGEIDVFGEVENVYAECKMDLSEPVRLRIHRSLSWLRQAERSEDLDVRFMCLWVAFNAAYAHDAQNTLPSADKIGFRDFLLKICSVNNDDIYHLVWQTYSSSIRNLLDSKYVFQPFWNHHNGIISDAVWQDAFSKARRRSHDALRDKDTSTILFVVFERLYTLRNQVFHGGSTHLSGVNRAQLKDAVRILSDMLPLFLQIMMSHPKEALWGNPYYPKVD